MITGHSSVTSTFARKTPAIRTSGSGIRIRTYERGVEDETLSCGTGVTASALSFAIENKGSAHGPIEIITRGGTLTVFFKEIKDYFTDIWLEGPAQKVFSGYYDPNDNTE